MTSSSYYNSSPHAKTPLGSDIPRVSSPDQLYINRTNGAHSPTPSLTGSHHSIGRVRSPTPSKRDLIRSKHPAPVHVSKLENVIGKNKGEAAKVDQGVTTDIGISSDEVYDEYLPNGLAWLRRQLIKSLRFESEWLAWHQPLVRTPLLDRYFVYTSLFGTHSFFLIFLPAAFWFGNPYFARGLVNVLAFGVYFSSAIKDLLCVPRPYSPPVTRLTVGSTHLEYGFPSTHSTNSVGTALYIWLWIHALRQQAVEGAASSIPGLQSWWWDIGLLVYAFSVVHGRVYAGMHSVMDCTAGSLLGAAITLAQWYGFDVIESWLATPGWTVPIVLISACLLLVSVHPEPLDDCPCFEDAIAFISVVNGVSLARWTMLRFPNAYYVGDINPLASSSPPLLHNSDQSPTAWQDDVISHATKALALIVGVLTVFVIRVVVKTSCKLALPRVFRFVDNAFGLVLPRRHYVPSSEYTDVPLNNIIRSPSFMDLPSSLTPMASGGPGENVKTSGISLHSRFDTSSSSDSSSFYRGSHLAGRSSRDASSGDATGARFDVLHDDAISRPDSPAIQVTSESQDRHAGGEEILRTASPSNVPLPSLTARLNDDQPLQRRGGGGPAGGPDLVQFAPSPQSSLSVPITHPVSQGGAQLPSDQVADRVAAELSADERKRQELLASGQVMHYDIDVLTKVLVYSNIGFGAAGYIPVMLRWLGLL